MTTAAKTTKTTRSTKAKTAADVPVPAQVARARVMIGVHQAQQTVLDTTETVAKRVPTLPTIPTPGFMASVKLPKVPSLEASTRFTFDFATELLNSQRDFVLSLARTLRSANA